MRGFRSPPDTRDVVRHLDGATSASQFRAMGDGRPCCAYDDGGGSSGNPDPGYTPNTLPLPGTKRYCARSSAVRRMPSPGAVGGCT
jgi:hypothetical protein